MCRRRYRSEWPEEGGKDDGLTGKISGLILRAVPEMVARVSVCNAGHGSLSYEGKASCSNDGVFVSCCERSVVFVRLGGAERSSSRPMLK